jgi:phosphonate metabolism protein PhnN/1,5-bisphosphokinase (PRPP-forming)
MVERGLLVLVVGASGVGKDTLLDAARALLAGNEDFAFPRREITRPADAGGEDHVAVDRATFEARRDSGSYALAWDAHGLGYGVPGSIEADLAAGRRVIVNASRTVIAAARVAFGAVRVVNVTAPLALRAQRLATRGREAASDIEARLARDGLEPEPGADVIDVANDSTIAEGVERFVAALRAPLR